MDLGRLAAVPLARLAGSARRSFDLHHGTATDRAAPGAVCAATVRPRAPRLRRRRLPGAVGQHRAWAFAPAWPSASPCLSNRAGFGSLAASGCSNGDTQSMIARHCARSASTLAAGMSNIGETVLEALHVGLGLAQRAEEPAAAAHRPTAAARRRPWCANRCACPPRRSCSGRWPRAGGPAARCSTRRPTSRSNSEAAQRHQHRIGQHHHAQQVVALEAAGRVVAPRAGHAPGGARRMLRGSTDQPAILGAGHQALLVTLAQPGMRRLLEVGMRPAARAGRVCAHHAAKCVARVLLPLPPLRLTMAMTGMSDLGPSAPASELQHLCPTAPA